MNLPEGTMKALTIRNLPTPVAEALEREKHRRGRSLNQTVIDLLGQSLGVGSGRSNGLGRLGGTWDEEDLREFERATAPFEQIDEELWQ
jgi:plasmid stability protein